MTTTNFDFSDGLEELRSQLTRRMSFVLIGFGILGAWYLLLRRDLPLSASGILCLLIILGYFVHNLNSTNAGSARYVLVCGMVGLLIFAMLIFQNRAQITLNCLRVSKMIFWSVGFETNADAPRE